LARACFQCRAARIPLHAAAATAGAAPAAHLHDGVADLAGTTAPDPRLTVEHDPAANAGAPEDPEHRAIRPARAACKLTVGRDLPVVADAHLGPERLGELLAEGIALLPVRQVERG